MIVKVIGDGVNEPRRPDVPEGVGYTVLHDHGDTMEVRLDEATQKDIEQKALGLVLKTLAQSNAISESDALDNQIFFDHWTEWVGKSVPADIFLRYDDGFYRVQSAHLVQAHYPPSVHTAALYSRVQPEGSIEAWQSGQSYAKDVEVEHKGGIWLSGVDNNVWEPGAVGVHENIWKEVAA